MGVTSSAGIGLARLTYRFLAATSRTIFTPTRRAMVGSIAAYSVWVTGRDSAKAMPMIRVPTARHHDSGSVASASGQAQT